MDHHNEFKVGIILAGCGAAADGSEIHEATLTMLALSQRGIHYQVFAPNIDQYDVVNHINGETLDEQSTSTNTTPNHTSHRKVLIESARIARGYIKPLSAADANELDGLIIPGGLGVTKNLCNYYKLTATAQLENIEGEINKDHFQIVPELEQLIKKIHKLHKPLGFLCIASIILPKLFGEGVRATLGSKSEDARAFSKMGGDHLECAVEHIVYDESLKIISTPAYKTAQTIAQAYQGIDRLVEKMHELLQQA